MTNLIVLFVANMEINLSLIFRTRLIIRHDPYLFSLTQVLVCPTLPTYTHKFCLSVWLCIILLTYTSSVSLWLCPILQTYTRRSTSLIVPYTADLHKVCLPVPYNADLHKDCLPVPYTADLHKVYLCALYCRLTQGLPLWLCPILQTYTGSASLCPILQTYTRSASLCPILQTYTRSTSVPYTADLHRIFFSDCALYCRLTQGLPLYLNVIFISMSRSNIAILETKKNWQVCTLKKCKVKSSSCWH